MRPLAPLSAALLCAVLLLVPTCAAHLAFDRPSIQPGQAPRLVEMSVDGSAATVRLLDASDPLRNLVRHDVDPAKGLVRVEHREDPPRAEDAFVVRLDLVRLAEYKDLNTDGRYTPDVDTAIRSWRLATQPWTATPVQNATVGGAKGKAVSWGANASGAPHFDLTAAVAGYDVTDEGARARPQDVILYVDLLDLPPRGTGSLHVLEGTLTGPSGARLGEVFAANNETVGVYVDHEGRRAFLLWGGQATIDGREQALGFTHGTPVGGNGTATWDFRLHFPLMDRGARLVMVSGVEYAPPQRDAHGAGAAWAALALVAAALAARRAHATRGSRSK